MNKMQTVESIQYVKKHHESQMEMLKTLLSGKTVNDLEPASKKECYFGKWLYNKENRIQEVLGLQFYENLENLHSQWHIQYEKIYEIFFKNYKKGFLSKVLKTNRVDSMEVDKAVYYYSELKVISEELLNALGASYRRASALNETKFID